MYAMERHYWWFQGRRKIILTLLDDLLRSQHIESNLSILDIGSGTGMLLDDLRQRGRAFGLDFSPTALSYCTKRGLSNLARADAAYLPVRTAAADVITAFDLIEHVKSDSLLLSEIHRVLKPGGFAIMSVPAHKKLWSEHDLALHHFRRYEKDEFLKLVNDSGMTELKYTYSMMTAYIPAFLFRNFKKLIPPRPRGQEKTDEIPVPKLLNTMLTRALTWEAGFLRKKNLAIGLSLLCIARKPEH